MSFGDDVRKQQYYGIVQSLASSDPFFSAYPVPPGLPALCHYCGAQKPKDPSLPAAHSPACLWARAVAVKGVSP